MTRRKLALLAHAGPAAVAADVRPVRHMWDTRRQRWRCITSADWMAWTMGRAPCPDPYEAFAVSAGLTGAETYCKPPAHGR